jgi:tripartite-type tricarboxylate transporter receptor subunit TctC
MRNLQRSARALSLLLGLISLAAMPARADEWPQRTVRFIVPLPPGTSTDLVARLFAERLSERWRQPVVVENRQGADGIPAVTGFVSARDNHTLLFSFAGVVTINPFVYDKLPYDPARDVVPVSWVADNFIGVAVPAALPVNSLEDFIKLARSQPGKLNWAASPGVPHYVFAALQKSTAIEMTQISYRDFRPALQDLGEGRIQAVATGVALLLPLVEAGKVKLLMVNNRQRSPQAPSVPTAQEAGYPDLTFEGAVGLYGWRDMPNNLKERIARDVRAIADDATMAKRVATMGSALRAGSPAEFAAAIEEQRSKIAGIGRWMNTSK